MRGKIGILLLASTAALVLSAQARADEDETPDPVDPCHTMHRAGYPDRVACYARPSDTHAYVGYPVGGGSPCRGDYPAPCDGTWGWDYRGCVIPRRVFLLWWHGRCDQGGTGAYKLDGPKLRHEK